MRLVAACLLLGSWLTSSALGVESGPIETNQCLPVVITAQPSSASLVTTNGVILSVGVSGSLPITFQSLYRDGVPIPGATSAILILSPLQSSDEGFYSVVVSNCGGSEQSRQIPIFVNGIIVDLPLPGTAVNFSGSLLPPGLTNIVAIAAGAVHALAVRQNGTVAAWGNDLAAALYLTNVPAGLSNVVAVCAGSDYSLALRGSGHLVGWGSGDCARVPPIQSKVTAIAGGPFRCTALLEGGNVVQWGIDLTLPPGLADVVAVAEASDYTLIAKRDGTLEAYGSPPGPLASQPGDVVIVAADHSCYAVTSHGSLSDLMVGGPAMPPGLSDVVSVSTSHGRCLALTKSGVVGWGNAHVPSSLRNVTAIAAGGLYCLALTPTPPPPTLSAGFSANRQFQLSAPLAVSGWILETAESPDQLFTPADLASSAIHLGSAENPALTLRTDGPGRLYRFRRL